MRRNESGMAKCAGCLGTQGSLPAKLGTCGRCMRIAAAGSLAGWGLVVAARMYGASRGVVGLLLLVAAQFSFVLVLHVVAKLVRVVFEPTRRGRTGLADGKPTRL
jgi:hypothetical protein